MRLRFSYRPLVLTALAISSLGFLSSGELAGATPRADRGTASAPGQQRKAEAAAASTSTPSAGTPTAADSPEGDSTHDATNGPGGQVCDGDPTNEPGAGGNYENTCPAGPSQNGAGDGQATGKPCAGCVGNADDKNPPGQATSGPTDANNGYECDQKGRSANEGNNGVGFGNPAHTGCTSVPPPPPAATCPDGSAMPASGDVKDCAPKPPKPETCPDGSAMPASGDVQDCGPKPPKPETCPDGSAMPASGDVQDCTTAVEGVVLAESHDRPTEVLGVELERPAAAAPSGGVLAFTGADGIGGLLRLAGLLGLAGGGLTTVTRRRRDDEVVDIDSRLDGNV